MLKRRAVVLPNGAHVCSKANSYLSGGARKELLQIYWACSLAAEYSSYIIPEYRVRDSGPVCGPSSEQIVQRMPSPRWPHPALHSACPAGERSLAVPSNRALKKKPNAHFASWRIDAIVLLKSSGPTGRVLSSDFLLWIVRLFRNRNSLWKLRFRFWSLRIWQFSGSIPKPFQSLFFARCLNSSYFSYCISPSESLYSFRYLHCVRCRVGGHEPSFLARLWIRFRCKQNFCGCGRNGSRAKRNEGKLSRLVSLSSAFGCV